MNGFRQGKKLTSFQLRMILERQKKLIFTNDKVYMNEDRADNVLSGGYYLNQNTTHNPQVLPYVSYIRNLPEEIRYKVNDFIKNNPIMQGRCWFNATNLHFQYPEIDVEHGYYYSYDFDINMDTLYPQVIKWVKNSIRKGHCKIDENNMVEITRFNPIHKLIKYELQELMGEAENHENQPFYFFYDKKQDVYQLGLRHSWNSYKGIHFDITGAFLTKKWERENTGYSKKWVRYSHSISTNPTSSYKETEPEFFNKLIEENNTNLTFEGNEDMNYIYKIRKGIFSSRKQEFLMKEL